MAESSVSWPPVEGRYQVGNPDSPVAVCTMATMEMDLPMGNIAIKGKCVTENIGVEKIIRNMISNPRLRFLVLCGSVSKGHFIEDAFENLKKNGVDGEKKIIGAKGGMPILKNLSSEEIERFRRQVEPINMSGEMDVNKILFRVQECIRSSPGPFKGEAIVFEEKRESVEELEAGAHPAGDWVRDPEGYFLVKPDREKGKIVLEHMSNSDKLLRRISGSCAEDLYHFVISRGWLTRQDHAAYLGRELAKAEQALRLGMEYVQDEDLVKAAPKSAAKQKPADPNMVVKKRTYILQGGKVLEVAEPYRNESDFDEVMERLNIAKRRF